MKWFAFILVFALPVSALAEPQCYWEGDWWTCSEIMTHKNYGNAYTKYRYSKLQIISESVIRYWHEYEFTAPTLFSSYSVTFEVNCDKGYAVAISATGTENNFHYLQNLKQPNYFNPNSRDGRYCESLKNSNILPTIK